MPEARQQEDNERIANDNGFLVRLSVAYAVGYGGAAATQRDIDVIAEPCGERDMPTPPKLRYVATEIRNVKVAHQFDTEQLGRAYGYVGVAREVAVNLYGEQHGCEQECAARVGGIISKYGVHVGGAVVRHDNLFEESPEDLAHAVHGLRVVEMPPLQELRQEVRGTLDRSRHELGKERQECGKRNEVVRRLYLPPINIYGIGQGLEGVETDTHRQHQVQEQAVGLAAKEFGKGTDKEIVVLVCAEDSEIDDDIDYHHGFAGARGLGMLYADAAEERAEGGESDEDKKPPVPPTIEDVTGNDYEEVLQKQLVLAATECVVEYKPIQQKHYRQENCKLNGVE